MVMFLPFVALRHLDCVLEPNKDKVHGLYMEYKDKIDVRETVEV